MRRTKPAPPAQQQTIGTILAQTQPAPKLKQVKQSPKYTNKKQKTEQNTPDTTDDGRVLGVPTVNYIPEQFQDVIPKGQGKTKKHVKSEWHAHQINQMTRTLMPLSITEDGEVETHGKKFRLNGINQAKFNAIFAGIRTGLSMTAACSLAGIHYTTLKAWLQRGERGESPYSVVCAILKDAEAECERMLLEAIIIAGTKKDTYQETTKETNVDEHGLVSTKSKTVTKVMHPRWQAAAWALERTRPAYRLTTEITPDNSNDNTGDDDILAMDMVTVGTVPDGYVLVKKTIDTTIDPSTAPNIEIHTAHSVPGSTDTPQINFAPSADPQNTPNNPELIIVGKK